MTALIDYADSRPAPATIKAVGYVGVMRYLAPQPNPKVITKAELAALRAADLAVGLVWETTAIRALGGRSAGQADGIAASRMADWLGYPHECAVYFAVDFGATAKQIPTVLDYFAGVRATASRPVGAYGSFSVVEAALADGNAIYAWQTIAWSSGHISKRAHLYQRLTKTMPPIPGALYDEDSVLIAGAGVWWSGAVPPSMPPPSPPIITTHHIKDGKPVAKHVITVPLDNNGNGSMGVEEGVDIDSDKLDSITSHAPHDPNAGSGDPDYILAPAGYHDAANGKVRIDVVSNNPKLGGTKTYPIVVTYD